MLILDFVIARKDGNKNEQTLPAPLWSSSNGNKKSSAPPSGSKEKPKVKEQVRSALSNETDSTYDLVEKSQKGAASVIWNAFKIVQRTADKALMDFVQCQTCKALFSYKK